MVAEWYSAVHLDICGQYCIVHQEIGGWCPKQICLEFPYKRLGYDDIYIHNRKLLSGSENLDVVSRTTYSYAGQTAVQLWIKLSTKFD